MKIRNRILTALLSFALAAGELLPVYAAGTEQESSAGEPEEAGEEWFEEDFSDRLVRLGGFPQEEDGTEADRTGDADTDAAEDAIIAGLKKRQAEINVSDYGIPSEGAGDYFFRVVNRHPDLFFVGGSISWSPRGNTVYSYRPSYLSYTDAQISEFYDTADRIIGGLDASWSKLEKVLYLHDYLVTHCDYEKTQPYSRYNAYNALVEGEAVCQGYSEAFEYLLQRIGVDGQVVTSEAINHAWNVLKLDGEWYYIDNTWDDPTNMGGPYCGHRNFLRSRDGMYKSKAEGGTGHTSKDWTGAEDGADIDATIPGGTAYDSYFWSESTSALPLAGHKTLTISGTTGSLYDFSTKSTKDYTVQSGVWHVWGQNSYWVGDFAQVTAVGGKFYYSTPDSIYSFATDGTQEKVYTLNGTESGKGYIYGLTADGAYVKYWLKYNADDDDYSYTGKLKVGEEQPQEKAAAPTADPADGSVLAVGDKILLSSATAGAKIRYTTDGNRPTESSALYQNGITVPESAAGRDFTVKAIAYAEGKLPSDVAVFTYEVEMPVQKEQAAAPTADPADGSTVAAGDTILLSCATEGAQILYTTDGTEPDEDSAIYTEGIAVPESSIGAVFTVKAVAVAEGYLTSDVAVFGYEVADNKTAAPAADPASGRTLTVGDKISLSCGTEGAKIYYTTDGSEPTESSALYSAPIVVQKEAAGKEFTIKAMAVCDGMEASAVASFVYKVSDLSALIIDPESVTITSAEQQIRLKATVYGVDGKVDDAAEISYTSGNTEIVTVGSDGTLTAVANGKTTVTVKSGKLSAECRVTVRLRETVETVFCTLDFYQEEVLISSLSVEYGQYADEDRIPTVEDMICWYDEEAGEIWNPSTPVTRNMQLYALSAEDMQAGHSALDPLPVAEENAYYLVKGQSIDLSGRGEVLIVGNEDGAVKLSKKGVLSAKKPGTAMVSISGSYYDVYVVEPQLVRDERVVKSLTLIPGKGEQLRIRFVCGGEDLSSHYPVLWYSSAPAVASVSGGAVFGIAKGSATITAYVNGKSYNCKVKVADTEKAAVDKENEDAEEVLLKQLTLQPFQSVTLKLQGVDFKNREWSSEEDDLLPVPEGNKTVYQNDIMKIDAKGKLTAIGSGSCTVYFVDEYETKYTLCVNVVEPQERRIFLNAGKSVKLKFYGVVNSKAEFECEDEGNKVAEVDDKGSVKGLGAGMTVIICRYNDVVFRTRVYVENPALNESGGIRRLKENNQYAYTLNMKAGQAPVALTFRTDGAYGVSQPVLFKSSKNNVVFVNEYGMIEARKAGKAVLTAKVNGKKITIKVTVDPADPE